MWMKDFFFNLANLITQLPPILEAKKPPEIEGFELTWQKLEGCQFLNQSQPGVRYKINCLPFWISNWASLQLELWQLITKRGEAVAEGLLSPNSVCSILWLFLSSFCRSCWLPCRSLCLAQVADQIGIAPAASLDVLLISFTGPPYAKRQFCWRHYDITILWIGTTACEPMHIN